MRLICYPVRLHHIVSSVQRSKSILNSKKDTDFLAAGGPSNYAWNVIRSEADELIFQHARKSGAKVFDGTQVTEIEFLPSQSSDQARSTNGSLASLGRPVSASYNRRSDGTSGTIDFEYLIDASGRAGLVSTRYLKNRKYNQGLKNVANWGYWKGTGVYAEGTSRANSPYFEALRDGSGWVWFIPLHDGTTSVGVVMNQDFATSKKREASSSRDFYLSSLKLVPNMQKLLKSGSFVSDLKSASDFSYSSSSYAGPCLRIVGDAGCFIDPFFSSGVHLAMVGALSAATTICAAIRGDCEEQAAAEWHSTKVADGYTRFLLVVLSAYKQIRNQNQAVLSDLGEDNLDRAFAHFRPVIQGTSDVSNITEEELAKTIDFCSNAWDGVKPQARAAVLQKMQSVVDDARDSEADESLEARLEAMKENLSVEEQRVMNYIRARQALRTEDSMHIDNFSTDVINGLAPNMRRGQLTLIKAVPLARARVETKQTIG
ncbi:MAG: hypothetical protein HETSPECPRED_002570 [Heterodermia speciosa]|uniref:Tryptophan halogenase n=1 Tax=Heterodermia speciosa TaxID=116794 RepID=A0A8H3F007_9LECA|nr:MAG: hypothetical protein HETSPECPRED_002570 [Heterodermia speciosa]